MNKQAPLAPKHFANLPAIEGALMAIGSCGIKYKDRADVLLMQFDAGTTVAGVFTKSKTASANILWGRKILSHGRARILLVNSGNANAFNGKDGEDSVTRIVDGCASLYDCAKEEIYPCATGVIGVPLPDTLITDSLSDLQNQLSTNSWQQAATAIMTTDTYPKMATRTAMIDGVKITINAIAKGSGMIAPDMATMLAYIVTDANITNHALQDMLESCCEISFNSITVDSDTSTSDTALIFATATAEHNIIETVADPRTEDFKSALLDLMLDLAHQIVKDGEGATKFIKIEVSGAENNQAAKKIALAIANSPLVKTAIAGQDANWGRIVMAVGKAGEQANRDKMSVSIGGITIAKDGQLNPEYKEDLVTSHMQGDNIDIDVNVGVADGRWTVWTCDLTHDYISINADYRS